MQAAGISQRARKPRGASAARIAREHDQRYDDKTARRVSCSRARAVLSISSAGSEYEYVRVSLAGAGHVADYRLAELGAPVSLNEMFFFKVSRALCGPDRATQHPGSSQLSGAEPAWPSSAENLPPAEKSCERYHDFSGRAFLRQRDKLTQSLPS